MSLSTPSHAFRRVGALVAACAALSGSTATAAGAGAAPPTKKECIENNAQDDLFLEVHVKEVVRFLSLGTHYDELLRGIVSTRSLTFFGVTIGLALFASVRGLESQRWK